MQSRKSANALTAPWMKMLSSLWFISAKQDIVLTPRWMVDFDVWTHYILISSIIPAVSSGTLCETSCTIYCYSSLNLSGVITSRKLQWIQRLHKAPDHRTNIYVWGEQKAVSPLRAELLLLCLFASDESVSFGSDESHCRTKTTHINCMDYPILCEMSLRAELTLFETDRGSLGLRALKLLI